MSNTQVRASSLFRSCIFDPELLQALAKSFGVSAAIVSDLKLNPGPVDKEDLAVGSSGLTSGRDRVVLGYSVPRNVSHWIRQTIHRSSNPPPTLADHVAGQDAIAVEVWLPRDRTMVNHIVDVYFTRLNHHRPVFSRREFERLLKNLYDNDTTSPHDPGFVMSLYLVLALGTLSELNHRFGVSAHPQDPAQYGGALGFAAKTLMPPEWPDYDEFFERALGVKPDLRVTVSSLQALILLHWYLYTEVGPTLLLLR